MPNSAGSESTPDRGRGAEGAPLPFPPLDVRAASRSKVVGSKATSVILPPAPGGPGYSTATTVADWTSNSADDVEATTAKK